MTVSRLPVVSGPAHLTHPTVAGPAAPLPRCHVCHAYWATDAAAAGLEPIPGQPGRTRCRNLAACIHRVEYAAALDRVIAAGRRRAA